MHYDVKQGKNYAHFPQISWICKLDRPKYPRITYKSTILATHLVVSEMNHV